MKGRGLWALRSREMQKKGRQMCTGFKKIWYIINLQAVLRKKRRRKRGYEKAN